MLLSQLLRLLQRGEEPARLVHRIVVAIDLQLGQQRLLTDNALVPLGHMTLGLFQPVSSMPSRLLCSRRASYYVVGAAAIGRVQLPVSGLRLRGFTTSLRPARPQRDD